MAGKFGSASVLFLVDGYNLLAGKLSGLGFKQEALHEPTTGLGDSTEATTPTGLTKATLTQTGGFFDTTIGGNHTALSTLPSGPQSTPRIVCFGWAGQTAGNPFTGLEGAYQQTYDVQGQVGKLTKANASYVVSGQVDQGIVIQPLAAFTGDWSSASVDNGAATTNGGVGYLQVTSSFGAFTGKIQHSANNSVWADLLTFTTVTASPVAYRGTVAAGTTVNRYLRFVGTVWGDISPSASISPSSSTSISPSSSVSPSISASASASATASQSASASVSPSSSRSPSSSLSPSISASASPSPTTAAGAQGSATVFCGFARG